jgi:hypothetical protein
LVVVFDNRGEALEVGLKDGLFVLALGSLVRKGGRWRDGGSFEAILSSIVRFTIGSSLDVLVHLPQIVVFP